MENTFTPLDKKSQLAPDDELYPPCHWLKERSHDRLDDGWLDVLTVADASLFDVGTRSSWQSAVRRIAGYMENLVLGAITTMNVKAPSLPSCLHCVRETKGNSASSKTRPPQMMVGRFLRATR